MSLLISAGRGIDQLRLICSEEYDSPKPRTQADHHAIKINYERILVVLRGTGLYLLGDGFVRPSIAVFEFDIRFIMNSIQILMKTIEEECQQLLRVVLLVAIEPWGVFANGPLQRKDFFSFQTQKCTFRLHEEVTSPHWGRFDSSVDPQHTDKTHSRRFSPTCIDSLVILRQIRTPQRLVLQLHIKKDIQHTQIFKEHFGL